MITILIACYVAINLATLTDFLTQNIPKLDRDECLSFFFASILILFVGIILVTLFEVSRYFMILKKGWQNEKINQNRR